MTWNYKSVKCIFRNNDEIKTFQKSHDWLSLEVFSIKVPLGRKIGFKEKRSEVQGMFIKENSKYVDKSKQTLAVENNNI